MAKASLTLGPSTVKRHRGPRGTREHLKQSRGMKSPSPAGGRVGMREDLHFVRRSYFSWFYSTAIYPATGGWLIAYVYVHYPFMVMPILFCHLVPARRNSPRKNGGSVEPPLQLELGNYDDPAGLESVPGADLDAADFAFASVLYLALAPEVLDADINLFHR